MYIGNYRERFANNSSSSHSVIFLKGESDNLDLVDDNHNYGWGNFTLASKEAKLGYLAAMIRSSIQSQVGSNIAELIAEGITGVNIRGLRYEAYVDHQSVWNLPIDKSGHVNLLFLEDLRNWLIKDGVVVLGGNDNHYNHPLNYDGILSDLRSDLKMYDRCVAYKNDDVWTLFDRRNGTKIRLSFDREVPQNWKSKTPELVDVKITDYCPFGCTYCYMGSTVKGKKTKKIDIHSLVYALSTLDVFEVAIGGGEPTLDPAFPTFMNSLKHYGIVPNFTTKNITWLRDEKLRNEWLSLCGSFAYSIDNSKSAEEFSKIVDYYNLHSKASMQLVLGTIDEWDYENIVNIAHKYNVNLTLLGFKETGFGKNYYKEDYSKWYEPIIKNDMKVSIDTLLAQQTDLASLGVPSWMFHTLEGKSSCYIDAVEGKIGASSYDSNLQDLDNIYLSENILKAFQSF